MIGARGRLGTALALCVLVPAASAAAAVSPPVTVDGPSAAIVSVGGVALARDGGGAVVYTKLVGAVAHVFVSLEEAGRWDTPVQVDAASAAAASAPAVAVADGGRVAVVWLSAGTLYGAVHTTAASAFAAPQAIAPAAGMPALGMGASGTAYVAYVGGAGDAVDVARLDRTSTAFAVLPGSLTVAPMTLASAGGPRIAVSADATAVVAWAQQMADGSTHVFVRRVSGAGPSPVLDDATPPPAGSVQGPADTPAVGIADDASDAWVAFRETVGGVSRVIVNQVLGDELVAPFFADSLGAAPGALSAATPSLAVNGEGHGLLASALAPSNALAVAGLNTQKTWTTGAVVNALPNTVAPAPVAALSADGRGVVAYSPGAGALAAELFANGVASGPVALSSAALGPVAPAAGLAAAADEHGDLLVAFAAGAPGALAVVLAPIVLPPSAPRAIGTQLWGASRRPVLQWRASIDHWAPATYTVFLDGARVATTTATSYGAPADIPDGRHTWKVVASDSSGQQASSRTRRLLIDGAPPVAHLLVRGARRAHRVLLFTVQTTAVSGVRAVSVDYGDGQSSTQPRSQHAYARAGTYTVGVLVTNRAGRTAALRTHVTVT